MALKKTFELPSGLTVDYWKIDVLTVDTRNNSCSCIVSVFKDVASRLAGKTSVDYRSYTWEGTNNPFDIAVSIDVNPFIVIYEKLKTLPEFANAIDA